ncbi:MAG: PAS domain S-box protein [Deltaproteobacteria bacterium]|nr:PAS domain S-box protein [Deltaproteobacteria bacterium]
MKNIKKLFDFIASSFYSKVLFVVIALLTATAGTLSYILIHQGMDSAEKNLLSRGSSITRSMALAGELAVYSKNKELMDSLLQYIMQEPGVSEAAFYDTDGLVLSIKPDNLYGKNYPAKYVAIAIRKVKESMTLFLDKSPFKGDISRPHYDFYAPVTAFLPGGEAAIITDAPKTNIMIGVLEVRIDGYELQKGKLNLVVWAFGISTGFLIIGCIASVFALKRFTKPLKALTITASRVAKGDYSAVEYACKSSSHDEIGVLAREFCRMIRTIQDRDMQILTLTNAVDKANDMIFMTDRTGKFIYTNKTFEETTGYSLEDLLDKKPVILKSGAQPPEFYKNLWKDTLNTGSAWSGETPIKIKNGAEFVCEVSITPVHDKHGKLSNFLAIMRDVTDKKRLENKLLQVQKLETIGTLAGGISHDFNNILTGVIGAASLLKTKISKDDKLFKYVDMVEQQGYRGAKLVHQLLGFARKGKYRFEPIDINLTLSELVSFCRETFDRAIEITEKLEQNLPLVEGDGNQIYQVFLNLCVNARDAMPGGGALFIRSMLVEKNGDVVYLGLNIPPGKYVCVVVTDTGSGMTKEVQDRLFEPFFTTKDIGKGTGLGLAMSYGIVKSHKGHIAVYSERGMGSSFKVYLPVTLGMEKQFHAAEQEEVKQMGQEKTILLVDDEPVLRELGKDILEHAGYKVYLAKNGEEAIEIYMKKGSDIYLIIMDMVMPNMAGREASEAIHKINPDAKIILSSGYAEDFIVRDLIKNNLARDFIQKPYRVTELLSKMEEVLKKP